MKTWLLVALGGSIGAMLRHGSAQLIMGFGLRFPLATLLVNLLGSALIGLFYVLLVQRMLLPDAWRPLLMTGLLGALTTFSTFSLETVLLLQQGQPLLAGLNVLLNVGLCLLVCALVINGLQ